MTTLTVHYLNGLRFVARISSEQKLAQLVTHFARQQNVSMLTLERA